MLCVLVVGALGMRVPSPSTAPTRRSVGALGLSSLGLGLGLPAVPPAYAYGPAQEEILAKAAVREERLAVLATPAGQLRAAKAQLEQVPSALLKNDWDYIRTVIGDKREPLANVRTLISEALPSSPTFNKKPLLASLAKIDAFCYAQQMGLWGKLGSGCVGKACRVDTTSVQAEVDESLALLTGVLAKV